MMIRNRNLLFVGIVFCAAVAFQLFLEGTGRADSIGPWYTVYAAIIYTAIVVGLTAVGFALIRRRNQDRLSRRS